MQAITQAWTDRATKVLVTIAVCLVAVLVVVSTVKAGYDTDADTLEQVLLSDVM